MSLVSSQTDVTSVTKFFSLGFAGNSDQGGPDGLNGAKVSALHSDSKDFVTVATWHSTNVVTFFNFGMNTLTSNMLSDRLRFVLDNVTCLAV